MKKKIFVFVLAVFVLSLVSAANCPPSIPKMYSGNVYDGTGFFNSKLDDAEYPLRAIMGSDIVGYGRVIGGEYFINVEPCFGFTGEISFVINGVEADDQGSYAGHEDWGASEIFDLVFDPKPPVSDTCGDSAIQLGEECDGINLGGRDIDGCGDGWIGMISCSSTCEISYSNCTIAPYCGDGVCSDQESCVNCATDCRACSSVSSSSGGSSSGGGGSSGGSAGGVSYSTSSSSSDGPEEEVETHVLSEPESLSTQTNEPNNFFSAITGAVIGGGTTSFAVAGAFILLALAAFGFVQARKRD